MSDHASDDRELLASVIRKEWTGGARAWVAGRPVLRPAPASTPGEVDAAAVINVLDLLDDRRLALVPAERASDVSRVVRTGPGADYGIVGDNVSSVAATWEDGYGTIPFGYGRDTVDFAVGRIEGVPWDEHAAELYGIAPDVVDQGTGSIRRLASDMESSWRIQLWWD